MKAVNLLRSLVALAGVLIIALPPSPSTANAQSDLLTNFMRAREPFLSQGALISWYASHPEEAPPQLRPIFEALRGASPGSAERSPAGVELSPGLAFGQRRFNNETGSTGLPQNEESVVFCPVNENEILMGTNDYRGLLDPSGNSTGWHYSNDGGDTVLKEGLQAEVTIGPADIPSQGDPVIRVLVTGANTCDFYAAGLAFELEDRDPNAIAVYKTSDATLNGPCSGAACWETGRAAASAVLRSCPGSFFLDKPWMDVGVSGAEPVVWVTYTEFGACENAAGDLFDSIKAVRCDADLAACSDPVTLTTVTFPDSEVQFSYVTIAPDGRVYVTWIEAEPFDPSEVFTIKMRVAPAGSTDFGPEVTVATETNPLGFFGFLSASDFRVLSIPQNTVLPLGGGVNRVYVAWPYCVQPAIPVPETDVVFERCRDSDIKVAYSDDDGASFTTVTITRPQNQYFPSIDVDIPGERVYIAFFSNEADPWNHRYQTILAHSPPDLAGLSFVNLNPAFDRGDLDCNGRVDIFDGLFIVQNAAGLRPLPPPCPVAINEPDADAALRGIFIGDYIEVFAHNGLAVVGYNANYTQLDFLGEGPVTYQQDNYLATFSFLP